MILPSVRAKIIELVPEIMELNFGVLVKHEQWVGVCVSEKALYEAKDLWDIWFENQRVVKTLASEHMEVLGSPISIREILMAIKEDKTVSPEAWIERFSMVSSYLIKGGQWNLEKDNLNEQSSETIEFLATILGVKI